MNRYSVRSKNNIDSVHPDLSRVFYSVLNSFDHSVLSGHRGEIEQNQLFEKGFSKLKFPESKHNSYPAEALDAMPYPILWPEQTEDFRSKIIAIERIYFFAGLIIATGDSLGIKIRWGGDWDRDYDFTDQTFHDLAHFELAR